MKTDNYLAMRLLQSELCAKICARRSSQQQTAGHYEKILQPFTKSLLEDPSAQESLKELRELSRAQRQEPPTPASLKGSFELQDAAQAGGRAQASKERGTMLVEAQGERSWSAAGLGLALRPRKSVRCKAAIRYSFAWRCCSSACIASCEAGLGIRVMSCEGIEQEHLFALWNERTAWFEERERAGCDLQLPLSKTTLTVQLKEERCYTLWIYSYALSDAGESGLLWSHAWGCLKSSARLWIEELS